MRRLIFLKINIGPLPDNISKTKLKEQEKILSIQAVKDFLKIVKKNKTVSVIQDLSPEPQVLIEFDENILQEVVDYLHSVDLVKIIDPHIPQK